MDGVDEPRSTPNPRHHVCTAVTRDATDQLWLVVGPTVDCANIDATTFTFSVEVRARNNLTGREVFARCVPRLVK